MDSDQLVSKLKQAARESEVFGNVCMVLATRERSRNSLTVSGLRQRMNEEGFHYTSMQYQETLKRLHAFELGDLMTTKRGTVIGIHNLKMTLQSIGLAACGESKDLETHKRRLKQGRVVARPAVIRSGKPHQEHPIGVTVYIKDSPVNISVPGDTKPEVLSQLIEKLRVS